MIDMKTKLIINKLKW